MKVASFSILLLLFYFNSSAQISNLGWSNGSPDPVGKVIGYTENGYWGLASRDNKKISFLIYSDLFPISNQYLVASKYSPKHQKKLWGIIDTKGKVKLDFQFLNIDKKWNHIIVQSLEGDFGILSPPATFKIPIKHKAIRIEKNFFVTTNSEGKNNIFDKKGDLISTINYDIVGALIGGTAKAYQGGRIDQISEDGKIVTLQSTTDQESSPKGSLFQLLDKSLQPILEFNDQEVALTPGGLIWISGNNIEKLITLSGKTLIAAKNIDVFNTSGSLVSLSVDGKSGVFDISDENELVPFQYDSTWLDDHFVYAKNCISSTVCRWHLFNHSGRKLNFHQLQALKPSSEGLLPVMKNDYWGYYDQNGATVIPFKYDSVSQFINGYALVKYVDLLGVINLEGDWAIPPHHNHLERIPDSNLFISTFNGRKNVINEFNNTIFTSYNTLIPHELGFIESYEGGMQGLFDKRGNILGNKYFKNSFTLDDNRVIVFQSDSTEHVWDAVKAYWVTNDSDPLQSVLGYGEGLISIKKNNRYGAIDKLGRLLIANRYDSIRTLSNGKIPIKIGEKWGTIDERERLVIQPEYEHMEAFVNGISIVRKNKLKGTVDTSGKTIIPNEYEQLDGILNHQYFIGKKKNLKYLLSKEGGIISSDNQDIKHLVSDYFLTQYRDKYGVVNSKARVLMSNTYSSIIYDSQSEVYLVELSR